MKFVKPLFFTLVMVVLLGGVACGVLPVSKSPTAIPTATPAPSETPTPTPLPPTSTPTPEPQIEGDGLIPPPPSSGPCANTLYPLVPGNQWIYEVVSERETYQLSLTVSEVEGNEAMLNTLNMVTGVTTETKVVCEEGAILNFPLLMLDFLLGEVDGSLEVERVDGLFSPAYQTFSSQNWDYAWTGEYTATGLIEIEDEGDHITGKLEESPVLIAWNTLGPGKATLGAVSVTAGEFPKAIKVQRKITINADAEIDSEGETMALETVLVIKTSLWFAPNYGLLKQEVESAAIDIRGISFPIILDGSVELVEFRATQ